MRTTVSERGQITVPKSLRERLGIRAGDQLELIEQSGHLMVRKALPSDPVASVFGILDLQEGSDEIIQALRGPADAV